MQNYLLIFTKYLLCIVSMFLTGMFAFQFSSMQDESISGYLSILLMVVIGLGVDLSKYLFWSNRKDHISFYLISSILVFFSWAASVSFFVNQEFINIESKRKFTVDYIVHQKKIDTINDEIKLKNKLVKKRMDSLYHEQWDKSEKLSKEISDLNEKLNILMSDIDTVGYNQARLSINTSSFFVSVAATLKITYVMASSLFYALLAMLIEICSIGMISLSLIKEKNQIEKNIDLKDVSKMSKFDKVRKDIIDGITPPIARNIIRTYGLRHASVKEILESLYKEGRLRKQNNIYVLNL